jgi:glycosyltransferase involved in cell wall biosynthesis
MSYWDLLIGMDLSVFPSYYEPWGYTPLESIAFSVPTITTDLSGFGQWIKSIDAKLGVEVVHRSDYNFSEVVNSIATLLNEYFSKKPTEVKTARQTALDISKKALWDEFIKYYYDAYTIALKNRDKRN